MGRLRRITAHCWYATSTFCQLNTVLVCGDGQAVIVDPGVSASELAGLVRALASLRVTCVFGLSTHPHWDHLLWTSELGEVPRYASAPAVDWLDEERLARARDEAAVDAVGVDLGLLGLVVPLPPGSIGWDGPKLELIGHDGHAPGHLGVVVPDDALLIAGDVCSDVEVPLLDLDAASGDPLGDYQVGLDELEKASRGCRVLIPGHGTVALGDAVAGRFAQDRAYLGSLADRADPADVRLAAAPAWLWAGHLRQRDWLAVHVGSGTSQQA